MPGMLERRSPEAWVDDLPGSAHISTSPGMCVLNEDCRIERPAAVQLFSRHAVCHATVGRFLEQD